MTAADDCAICAMVRTEPSDGWAYHDEHWVAGTLPGLEIPGWIVLALRRHAVEAAPLTEPEAASLGAAIGTLSSAITGATDAERVYLQAYGERERHWHLLISARGAAVPPEHRHVAFFTHREAYVDPAESAQVLERVRALVGRGRAEVPS